jgi:precorrin-6A/cobalt-precorrin-6A reductase
LPAPDKPVLILGGTKEAADLASTLFERGINVTTSLAGRTREPLPLKGKTRVGGFGGVDGLANYLAENQIALVIDMTHPFAVKISENAQQAAVIAGVERIAWQRPKWEEMEEDNWRIVNSIPASVTAIPSGARVLLALGSQHIAPFAQRNDVHFLVRMIDAPKEPITLPHHTLLLAKPGSLEEEFATMQTHAITHVVARNSGGAASYTKIAAARLLGLPVIMIEQATVTPKNHSFDALLEEIFSLLA